jgi:hypothetical protein
MPRHPQLLLAFALALALAASAVAAKPIAFARGTTVMFEEGAGTMREAQAFYAPRYWWSLGAGWLELVGDETRIERRIRYARANFLARRWNLPNAQANVFAWGGLGRATGDDFEGSVGVRNIGVQADYETRRVYTAFRSDLHDAGPFSHRIDTLQLGWAPYAHDYDTVATWFVLQARTYTGGLYDGVEPALLVRLFKGGAWIELGATADGRLQAMAMFNF